MTIMSKDNNDSESSKKVLDPELYSAKRTPLDHVKYFISEKLRQLGWGQTEEKEVVLDVGCGPGGNTLQLILPLFPQAEKIFAIDFLPNMIEFARIHNCHPLIEYNAADIENWSMVQQWKGQISKIISIHCVQWLKDKKQGFQNMFELLKPGGEVAFCLVMESPVYASILALKSNSKWNKFVKDADDFVSDDHINKYESSRYLKLLMELGFDVLYFEQGVKSDPFTSDEEYRDFFASICALVPHVPSDQREEFKDDMFQEMLNRNGRDSSGRPVHRANIIEVVARKKSV
ncbi:juvenile hormone acid O-methyltransferase-like isoform X1 [Argiope bruennichi]|uniref:juvenile hormone acid O-methyltransferase-like isoform X1 n=1 Tax=Argiope bruennichi TaxID=94029 RepID=UPI0024947744|nr:juvenile hormone acid O-methyltransferase-like isoform X1 [Argiope bruennichi]